MSLQTLSAVHIALDFPLNSGEKDWQVLLYARPALCFHDLRAHNAKGRSLLTSIMGL